MARKKTKTEIPKPPRPKASPEESAAYFEKYGMEELEAAGYVHDLSAAEHSKWMN
ncbi:MAG TPA: hypothetical protein V6C69_09050 [Trichormus sp.]|jgi:hypothetical protein